MAKHQQNCNRKYSTPEKLLNHILKVNHHWFKIVNFDKNLCFSYRIAKNWENILFFNTTNLSSTISETTEVQINNVVTLKMLFPLLKEAFHF